MPKHYKKKFTVTLTQDGNSSIIVLKELTEKDALIRALTILLYQGIRPPEDYHIYY